MSKELERMLELIREELVDIRLTLEELVRNRA